MSRVGKNVTEVKATVPYPHCQICMTMDYLKSM